MTTRGGLQGRPLFDALHKRCRVWWPLEAQWYSGTVAHWMAAAPSGEPAAVGVVCGGRGWFLVRALSATIRVERGAGRAL
ncbi:hypothetical protein T492DRAFT_872852, partial [Pavlovales sp. CCMP2436]